MSPLLQIKVGAKLAIRAGEQIQIKLCGHADTVVVSALECVSIFLQVDPDQKPAVASAIGRNAQQELSRGIWFKIANGRSRKIDNLALCWTGWRAQTDRLEIIGAYRQDFQFRENFSKQRARSFQLFF